MSLESVIGENSSQIRMVGEKDSVHVPDFSLVPVRSGKDGAGGLDGREFVGVGLDANARVETQRQ